MVRALLAASEAITASKQPLSLQVKLVTPIHYMTKFQGTFISLKMPLSGDDNQGPLTCVAIATGNNEAAFVIFDSGVFHKIPGDGSGQPAAAGWPASMLFYTIHAGPFYTLLTLLLTMAGLSHLPEFCFLPPQVQKLHCSATLV